MLEPPNGSSVVVWQKRVKHPNIFPELVRFIQLEVIFKKRREIKYKDTCFFFSFLAAVIQKGPTLKDEEGTRAILCWRATRSWNPSKIIHYCVSILSRTETAHVDS